MSVVKEEYNLTKSSLTGTSILSNIVILGRKRSSVKMNRISANTVIILHVDVVHNGTSIPSKAALLMKQPLKGSGHYW